MRMKTQRILAALLSLVLLLALAPAGWAVDVTTPNNTVEVNLVSQQDYAADIVKAKITVLQSEIFMDSASSRKKSPPHSQTGKKLTGSAKGIQRTH